MKKIIILTIALARLLANAQQGVLDTTFANHGKAITILGNANDYCYSIIIKPDDKILLSGGIMQDGVIDFALLQYHPDGSIDSTFGTDGLATTDFDQENDWATASGLQSNGKIILGGHAKNGTFTDFALSRYNESGVIDSSFGTNGKVLIDGGANYYWDTGTSMVIQPDDKILLAGYSDKDGSGIDTDFMVLRLNADGSRDGSFGQNGIASIAVRSPTSVGEQCRAIALQADGKILLAGSIPEAANGGPSDFALVRLHSNGLPDNSFGQNGTVITAISNGPTLDIDVAYSVFVQPDEKIVLGGITNNGSDFDFVLVRYTSNGTLDSTFGTNGIVITAIDSSDDRCYSVKLQPDGKILGAGFTEDSVQSDFVIIRYNADGSLDSSFGNGGIAITNENENDVFRAIGFQSDGKIVAAGSSGISPNYDYAVVRYFSGLPVGVPDAVFASPLLPVSLYPNPVVNQINVDVSQMQDWKKDSKVEFVVYDATGKQWLTMTSMLNQGKQTIPIDIPVGVPQGYNLLEIRIGEKKSVIPFIKIN